MPQVVSKCRLVSIWFGIAGGYALNPMVEINFRHTMGHVAVALRGKTEEKTFRPEPRG